MLIPSSEISGPMAIQEGAKYLERAQGGHGVLLGGVPGVDPGTVLIIGAGVVGLSAAKMACGLGANVYVLDTDLDRLRYLSDVMPRNCMTSMSNPTTIRDLLPKADVVVGAVIVAGGLTPKLVTREMIRTMKPGAVLAELRGHLRHIPGHNRPLTTSYCYCRYFFTLRPPQGTEMTHLGYYLVFYYPPQQIRMYGNCRTRNNSSLYNMMASLLLF